MDGIDSRSMSAIVPPSGLMETEGVGGASTMSTTSFGGTL